MTMHVASPVAHPARVRDTLAELRARSRCHAVSDVDTAVWRPVDDGVLLGALDPQEQSATSIDLHIAQRRLADLQYINGDTYRAALALPNFVRALAAAPGWSKRA